MLFTYTCVKFPKGRTQLIDSRLIKVSLMSSPILHFNFRSILPPCDSELKLICFLVTVNKRVQPRKGSELHCTQPLSVLVEQIQIEPQLLFHGAYPSFFSASSNCSE